MDAHGDQLERVLAKLSKGSLPQSERPHDLIDWADMDIDVEAAGSVLGQGAFGTVYRGGWNANPVAVKMFVTAGVLDPANTKKLYLEANLMSMLPQHPNVVRYFGVVLQKPHYALVIELCGVPGPHPDDPAMHTLADVLRKLSYAVPWAERLALASGIAAGMAHLHGARVGPVKRSVVHGDLKAANVLLMAAGYGGDGLSRFVPKIADFGLARIRGSMSATFSAAARPGAHSVGTLLWMAPEVMAGGSVGEASDVYSFGMVLFELLARRLPFESAANQDHVVRVLVERGERPTLPAEAQDAAADNPIAADLAEAMQMCWVQEPRQRPTFAAMSTKLLGQAQLLRRQEPDAVRNHLDAESVSHS